MRTTSEAPVAEPQPVERAANPAAGGGDAVRDGDGARIGRWRRDRGARPRLRRASRHRASRPERAVRRGAGRRRPLRLRQVDPAGAGQRPARASDRRDRGRRGRARPPSASPAARTCRSATCCFRGWRRSTTPRWRCETGAPRAPRRAGAAHPLFERFGLAGFERSRPAELSGGMRQRIAFLRTLLAGKPVLLLDEPFASLDAITRAEMQEWLAEALAAESRTVILVTPRRRGGALPVRPGGGALGPPRERGRRARRARAPSPAAPRRRHLARASLARERASAALRGAATGTRPSASELSAGCRRSRSSSRCSAPGSWRRGST